MEDRVQYVIETQGLTRRFGRQVAVSDVALEVPERSIYGFLGQNGAGKTTTIRMLLGLLKPNAGTARLFGIDVGRRRLEAARLVGALVETPCHYDHLTGRENLGITARLLGADRREVERVLDLVDLAGAADRRVGGYSLGMRQRLGVARALIGRPKLLILDEPTNGLDPNGIRDMRALIRALPEAEGVTLFVSSHILAEVEQSATHVGMMHEGRLLLQSPVAELKARRSKRVVLTVDRPAAVIELLAAIGLQARAEGRNRVRIGDGSAETAAREIATINFLLVEKGVRVSGIQVCEPSLEDIFHDAIEPAGAAAPALPFAIAA
jgi:ABC-2 type transport system ATP-binding protein